MSNLIWTHYRELLAVNEEKARYEGEDGKGNPIYSSKYLLLYLLQIYFHIKEICDICESRTHLFFLTDGTDHTDFHVADCNRSLHQELRKGLFISHWRSRRIIG